MEPVEVRKKRFKMILYFLLFSLFFLIFFTIFMVTGIVYEVSYTYCQTKLNTTPVAFFEPYTISTQSKIIKTMDDYLGVSASYTLSTAVTFCIGHEIEVRYDNTTERYLLCSTGYLYRYTHECHRVNMLGVFREILRRIGVE
ncbi:MAG: hypothetical protein GXO63_00915 [Candidatus Micrarchaeota archaeon]|nr:hypothetical protein [Candidatus Micrarchaeota archaeon]